MPYTRAEEVSAENIAELFPERARLKGPRLISFDFARVFTDNIGAQVDDVIEAYEAWPFDRLVCDGAFSAASILGPRLAVPVHCVEPGPSLAPSRDVPPPFFSLPSGPPIPAPGWCIVWCAAWRSTMRDGLVALNRARGAAGLATIRPAEVFACLDDVSARVCLTGIPEIGSTGSPRGLGGSS